jgi:hypothetical protein
VEMCSGRLREDVQCAVDEARASVDGDGWY